MLIVDWNNVSLICKTEFSYKCLKTILSPKNKPLLFASAKWIGRSPNESAKTTQHFVLTMANTAVVCFVEKFSFLVKKAVYFVNIMLISRWVKSLKLLSSYRFDVKNKASVFVWKTRKRIQTFFYLRQKFQITNENAMTSTFLLLLLFFFFKNLHTTSWKTVMFFFHNIAIIVLPKPFDVKVIELDKIIFKYVHEFYVHLFRFGCTDFANAGCFKNIRRLQNELILSFCYWPQSNTVARALDSNCKLWSYTF